MSASTTCSRPRTRIFSLLYTSNAAWNETRWNNAAFDKLVAEARTTIDEAKRRELYAEAQKLMHDEVPSIIPVFFDLLAAQRDYVAGLQAASARRGLPPRPRLARRRARRSAAEAQRGSARVAELPSASGVGADRLHAVRGVAAGLRHHADPAGRRGGDDAGRERDARALAAVREQARPRRADLDAVPALARRRPARRLRHLAAHRPAGRAGDARGARAARCSSRCSGDRPDAGDRACRSASSRRCGADRSPTSCVSLVSYVGVSLPEFVTATLVVLRPRRLAAAPAGDRLRAADRELLARPAPISSCRCSPSRSS